MTTLLESVIDTCSEAKSYKVINTNSNFSIEAFYCIILTLCCKCALKGLICLSILPPGYLNKVQT